MSVIAIILAVVLFLNIMLVLTMIFTERKKPQSIISWLIILTFFPVIGFIFYILVGSGLSFKTKIMLKKMNLFNLEYQEYINYQKKLIKDKIPNKDNINTTLYEMMLFNINNSKSACFMNNKIEIYTNGKDKVDALIKDIQNAKYSINMLYYIFANDEVGSRVITALKRKIQEGVKVNFIYDSVGCIKYPRRFYNQLKKMGANVVEFFPPLFGIRLMNLKLNYRNHRKIVVIDGQIGYVGGINLRDDHMGKKYKLSPWRDTHVRVEGDAAFGLQFAFFNDFSSANKKKLTFEKLEEEGYFPKISKLGDTICQVVTSGPEFEEQRIKDAMIKMITLAKHRVCLQTPYFVPDDTFINAIRQALVSGVQVDIMIPKLPDKKTVHLATMSYIKEILSYGVNVYLYNGFLHSKVLIVDDKFITIGTTNVDNRSFALNFEINLFFYGVDFINKNIKIFENDMKKSQKISLEFFRKKRFYTKLGQAIFRLFSPLL